MSPLRARRLWTARGRLDTTVMISGAIGFYMLALAIAATGIPELAIEFVTGAL